MPPRDYSHQDLRNRSFRRQDLAGANFSHTDLRGCDFTGATLVGANFHGCQTGQSHEQIFVRCAVAVAVAMDKILLGKRTLIETVNDQLKNICRIEYSRHRSV